MIARSGAGAVRLLPAIVKISPSTATTAKSHRGLTPAVFQSQSNPYPHRRSCSHGNRARPARFFVLPGLTAGHSSTFAIKQVGDACGCLQFAQCPSQSVSRQLLSPVTGSAPPSAIVVSPEVVDSARHTPVRLMPSSAAASGNPSVGSATPSPDTARRGSFLAACRFGFPYPLVWPNVSKSAPSTPNYVLAC